ncbi:MAG TPA: Crp/Fnr family transcriptional regulator [Bacilli bacterium]|nr:MAG: cAMP-activated global transcriptional regulator CRP [Tenericutes bacterium ADurb.BinA124]HNZ50151.1 Crp/Fnr family transcriptional regulator [Bacilli bacterium]HPN60517.1 Crp/Fnr family transcriptional regulator [Bacilli bacterium]HPX84788.1 Crp/Fnr family transcriptional regulator [Bacilli bacterium]HQC74192.1 Crp/Fnr family transcriptional regulator [Bacilli bacterium]
MNVFKDYLSLFSIKTYPAKTTVFSEGEPCSTLGLVLKGGLDVITDTGLDSPFLITHLKKDDCFGEYLLFSDCLFYLGSFITVAETTIAFITKEKLLMLLSSNPLLLEAFLKKIGNNHLFLQNRLKALSQKTLKNRLLFYLNFVANRTKQSVISIKSKERLAQYLNMPRPSLSRELQKLKHDGFIDYDLNSITLIKRSPF